MMRHPAVLFVAFACVSAASACGGGDEDAATSTTPPPTSAPAGSDEDAATSTTTPPTDTTTTTVTTAAPDQAVTLTEDIEYLEKDEHKYLLDVYVPNGDGPWPVVLAFHGAAARLKNDAYLTVVAKAAAEAGMVVFAPSWMESLGKPLPDDLTSAFEVSTCALAFAQQEAAAYGGDPDRIVTYGFSAGSQPAAWLALGHATTPISGCMASGPTNAPVGAVLGDSEYFMHTTPFDLGFDTDSAGMQAHVAALVDPTTWPDDLSARFRIWSAPFGTGSRTFDDAWDDDGWFAQRDPDGTIRADLDALGQLDDGIISFFDEGILLAYRLESVGADVTVDEFPGGHQVGDKLPELVAYLLDAAGPS